MKKILFKGKRKDNGQWVYGFYWDSGSFASYIKVVNEYGNVVGDYEVYPESVGQYVGLCDKKGRQIFDGDMVSYTNNQQGTYEIGRKMKGVVVYSDYTLTYCSKNNFQMDNSSWMFANDLKVIGNVYGDTELLENKNET